MSTPVSPRMSTLPGYWWHGSAVWTKGGGDTGSESWSPSILLSVCLRYHANRGQNTVYLLRKSQTRTSALPCFLPLSLSFSPTHTHSQALHVLKQTISHSALQEVGRRRLRNTVLGYLSCDKSEEAAQRAKKQYDQADCMTDRVAGLGLLANMGELSWYLDDMALYMHIYIHIIVGDEGHRALQCCSCTCSHWH